MYNVAPLCLGAILMLHCVYAEYYPVSNPLLFLYNPSNGRQMDPRLLRAVQLRSSGQLNSQKINDNIINLPSLGMPCSCEDYACKCCLGIGFGDMKQIFCIKIQYDWRVFGVIFFIEWNDRLLASFGISAGNIPDFCAPLMLPIPMFTCLRLSNIQIVDIDNSLNLCTSLVFKIIFRQIFEYKFSCLRLSSSGVSIVQDTDRDAIPTKAQLDQLMSQPTNDKLQIYKA